eukprot:comp5315_c0_seq1/m.1311 comp5315_c0_seq1/g.1311  ORF comp5315_c0_seq1/g.1311 comp5315_c0_seq1/m.1311 type:complete len:215 (-) comp5315_c0_seq1:215-859(-)
MAPKASADDANEKILKYLNTQNRPYSAVDVFNNLHGDIGKTQVVKSLEQLAKEDRINEKVYGKQKVYCPKQNGGQVSEKEMRELEEKIAVLAAEAKQLQEECKPLEQRAKELSGSLSTGQIQERLKELREQNAKQREALASLQNGSRVVSKAEVAAVEKQLDDATKLWRKRKRTCCDVVDMLMENYPKKKKDLFEAVGIETDEDAGVDLKAFGL